VAKEWVSVQQIPPAAYICSYCGNAVGADKGYPRSHAANEFQERIAICPLCFQPTYINSNHSQIPGTPYGAEIEHLPVGVKELYDEARNCFSVNAYTSAVLICRKLLMHIGVEQGAKENQNFVAYVEHLAKTGYVPPNGKARATSFAKGNEANHEIIHERGRRQASLPGDALEVRACPMSACASAEALIVPELSTSSVSVDPVNAALARPAMSTQRFK
jgi:hypothetical protein